MPSSNLLSPTLKKIIHVEENPAALVEPRGDVGLLPSERMETTTGIRCLTVSPDGRHLVAGTKSGNLHVIDLSDPEMTVLDVVSAHELDVQCVEFSDSSRGAPHLLASGGRDRLVHLFRPEKSSYEHCYVIDDHQSALNAVRFVQNHNGDLYLFTCGSDKTIIIWRLVIFTQDTIQFIRENLISAQIGINDLLVPTNGATLLTSCQDRQLRSYSLTGKLLTVVRGTGGEADIQQGSLGKFCLDPSCTYAASVCSDRHVYVVEVRTGKCVAAVTGIGESATDVEFSEDCRRLYVTASNGCIYVWRLSDTLVGRMQAAKATLDSLISRSESPDSLLGSGSEAVSEELPIENSDTSSPQFGSGESLDQWNLNETVTLHRNDEKGDERDGSLIVRPAQVTRRSASNLLGSTDTPEGSDHDESKSDFISKRREPPSYTSSKSMMNLRDASLSNSGMHGVLTEHLDQPPRRIRSRWGDPTPNWYPQPQQQQPQQQQKEWEQPSSGSLIFQSAAASPANQRFDRSPQISSSQAQYVEFSSNGTPRSSRLVQSPMAASSTPQTTSAALRTPPTTPAQPAGLSHIAALSRVQQQASVFRRDSPDRDSLSKRHMQQDGQPRAVWSPQALAPRRSPSNMQSIATPSGAAASAITRRQADYNDSSLHLRSRSQSPNHVLLSQQQQQQQQNANRSAPSSATRELTKEMQRRRDSDMSYTAASSRLTPANSRSNLRNVGVDGDTRKSTEKLNRINALRSKLHQSSENLRMPSDNLRLTSAGDGGGSGEGAPIRTRSISNLRGANALEAYGTFDADHLDSASSLMHSRLLARSVGNVSSAMSGGESGEATAASRLQNTIDMLKKASNPDLTQCSSTRTPAVHVAKR